MFLISQGRLGYSEVCGRGPRERNAYWSSRQTKQDTACLSEWGAISPCSPQGQGSCVRDKQIYTNGRELESKTTEGRRLPGSSCAKPVAGTPGPVPPQAHSHSGSPGETCRRRRTGLRTTSPANTLQGRRFQECPDSLCI